MSVGTTPATADQDAGPYPGLRPFERGERFIFFGRDEQVKELLKRMADSRFLAVVGVSGCGKSSLVRAGLIDALEAGFLPSAGERWRVATMRPRGQPFRELAAALVGQRVVGPGSGDDPAVAQAFLEATLRRGPLGLVEALREERLPANESVLLVVDQFEEIFRFHRHGGRDEADAFVALLLESAEQKAMPPETIRLPVFVVLTMRSDFLGDCAIFSGLPEVLNVSQFLTPRLTRQQRREATMSPAVVFGGRVEEDLATRVLNDMGADPDQLPLMQHALMRIWKHARRRVVAGEGTTPDGPPPAEGPVVLTLRDYEAAGGRAGVLGDEVAPATLLLATGRPGASPSYFAVSPLPDTPADRSLLDGLPSALKSAGAGRVGDVRVEPALVGRLLGDIGADPNGLARLPHALASLWDRARLAATQRTDRRPRRRPVVLTQADYDTVGGITDRPGRPNALSLHTDEVLGKLDERGRGIAEVLFRSLTERGPERRDTRRPTTLQEVWDVARERLPGTTLEDVIAVVDVFRAPDLSVVMPPSGEKLDANTLLDITHESLIRQWKQLRDWVTREAESAETYRRLAQSVALSQAKRAGLLQSPELDDMLKWRQRERPGPEWAKRYGGQFESAAGFLDESAKKARRARLLGGMLLLLAFAIVPMTGLTWWAFSERANAIDATERTKKAMKTADEARKEAVDLAVTNAKQAETNRALRLSTQSQDALRKNPQRALLLAAEAVKGAGSDQVPSAEESLRQALATCGGRGFSGSQVGGHSGPILAAEVSPDGKTLATGGADGTVRLWDMEDPSRDPVVLASQQGRVSVVAFLKDGRLVTAGEGGAGLLWNLQGKAPAQPPRPEATLASPAPPATAAGPPALQAPIYLSNVYSPASRRLVLTGLDSVHVYDLDNLDPSQPRVIRHPSPPAAPPKPVAPQDESPKKDSAKQETPRIDKEASPPPVSPKGGEPKKDESVKGEVKKEAIFRSSPGANRFAELRSASPRQVRLVAAQGTTREDPPAQALAAPPSDAAVNPPGNALPAPPNDYSRPYWSLSPEGRWLIASSADTPRYCWDLNEHEPRSRAITPMGGGQARGVSRNGRWAVATTGSRSVLLLPVSPADAFTASLPPARTEPASEPKEFVALFGGRWLCYTQGGRVLRADLDAEAPFKTPLTLEQSGTRSYVNAIASRDNRWLACDGDSYQTFQLWDFRRDDPAPAPVVLEGSAYPLSFFSVSPDGRRLIAGEAIGNIVRYWDLKAPLRPATRALNSGSIPLAAQLVGHDETGAVAPVGGHGSVTGATFSPTSTRLVTTDVNGTARLWDLSRPNPAATEPAVVSGGPSEPNGVAPPSPISPQLVPIQVNTILVNPSGMIQGTFPSVAPPGRMNAGITGNRRWLYVSGREFTRFWDLSRHDPAADEPTLIVKAGTPQPLLVSLESRWLLAVGLDGRTRLGDMETDQPFQNTRVLPGADDPILIMIVSPDGRWLIDVIEKSGGLRAWEFPPDASPRGPIRISLNNPGAGDSPSQPDYGPVSVAFAPGRLLVIRQGVSVRSWTLTATGLAGLPTDLIPLDGPRTAFVSPDGRWAVSLNAAGDTDLYKLTGTFPWGKATRLRTNVADRESGQAQLAARDRFLLFTADNRGLLDVDWSGHCQLYDLASSDPGTLLDLFDATQDPERATVAVSPDRRWLVFSWANGAVRLGDLTARPVRWSAPGGRKASAGAVAAATNSTAQNRVVAFDARSRWLIIGSADKQFRLWDLSQGGLDNLVELRGLEGPPVDFTVTADRSRLAAVMTDGVARLWDLGLWAANPVVVRDAQAASDLPGTDAEVSALAFGPADRALIGACGDSAARVWDLRRDDLLAKAAGVAGRNLTRAEWEQYFPGEGDYRKTFVPLPLPPSPFDITPPEPPVPTYQSVGSPVVPLPYINPYMIRQHRLFRHN